MKKSRMIVAGVAVLATMGAFVLSSAPPPAPPEPTTTVVKTPPMPTVDVLVATVDLPMGQLINEPDVRWQPFPKEASNPGFILKEGADDGEAVRKSIVGSIARYPFVANEPMRREKLIQPNGSGFLAAILPPGKRAVAITTDASGATTAGGFILPNDYVDIIRVFRDEDSAARGRPAEMRSEVVVSNVRVLAVGQNVQERGGEKFITSQTATLELDPRQTEQIILAQRQGTLSLALRSIQDANRTEPVATNDAPRRGVTLVRFGLTTDLSAK